MSVLGALEIQMYADIARLRQDMAQAKSVVGDAAKSMQTTINAVGNAFQALGVGLSVGAFTAWMKGAIDAADEASKLAQKTGVATEKIAGLKLAFEQSGAGGAEVLQKSMSKLSSEIVKGNDVLTALGIKSKDTREALGQIADKFAGMADGTAKAAAAVGIWGEKLGANMIPLLNAGSKGLEEMDAMAQKLGLSISTETGQAAEKFNDTLQLLGLSSKGLATQALAQLLPSMNAFAGALLESRTEAERMQRGVEVLATALKGLFSLVAGGAEVFNVFGKLIGGAAAAAAQMLGGGGRDGAAAALRATFDDIKAGVGSTGEMIKNVWNGSAQDVAEKSAEWAKQQRLAAQAADELMRKMQAQSAAAKQHAEEVKKANEMNSKSWVQAIDDAIERDRQLAMQLVKEAEESMKLREEAQKQISKGYVDEIDRRIEQEREAAMQLVKISEEADRKILEEWQRTVDQMSQSLVDALMEGGKNIAGYLQGLFRTLVLRPILMPAATAMASAISGPASAATGGGASGVGGLLNIGSALGSIGGFGATAGAGFSATLGGAGLGDLLGAAGAAIGNGAIAGGAGLAIGAIAPYAMAAVAAYYIGKKLFGRKLADTGVEGTFDASGDFSGSAYKFYKGGLLRKDKTRRSTLDPALDATLDAGATAMAATVRSYAEVLGLPVAAINGYSQQIKLSLKGLNEEQIKAKIEEAVSGFGEGLAARFAPALQMFQKAGETLSDTLTRLAGLQTFSNTLADLGGVFARVAGLSVDAREAFIAMAGGMDTLSKNALQFVQDYYNRDEIAGIKAAEIKSALQAVGITQDVNSRDEFRALVDSINVSTEAGQQQLAALLDMAQGFTTVADYLTETGGSLSSVAAQSPGGVATSIFASGGAADQLAAINNVGFWSEAIFNAIKEQTAAMVGGSSAAATMSPKPEVNGGLPATNWQWGPDGGYYGV